MKILFVLGFPIPFAGAAWARINSFNETWCKKNYRADILGAFTQSTLEKRGAKKYGSTNIFNLIFHVDMYNPSIFSLNTLISFIVSMFFLIAKRPNVTIVSVPTGDVGLGALIACRLTKIRCIVDYRDEWEDYAKSRVNHKIEKVFYSMISNLALNLYAESNLIAAVTPKILGKLEQKGLANVRLVPNGADVKTFQPSYKNRVGFKLLYSGGIGGYYRLDVVLKAIKRLTEKGPKDLTLVIVGNGAVTDTLLTASELNISDNVEYKGVINNKTELATLIAEADVGLIPYDDNPLWKNALPAKFFEYCACGLPVIATVCQGAILGDLIQNHQIGITSPPLDDLKLSEAIYQVYNDKSFREKAGRNARGLIQKDYDRVHIAEKFLEYIDRSYNLKCRNRRHIIEN